MSRLSEVIDPRVAALSTESALALTEDVDLRRDAGEPIARLTLGESPFPVPERMVAALRDAAHEKHYAPARGLPELRRAIARHLVSRASVDRTADDVVVGPGSKDLLFLLQIVFSGEIVVATPSWGASFSQARLLGKNVLSLETRAEDGFLLRPEALAERLARAPLRPRMLLLNYPANPSGLTYQSDELREFARIARQHELLVLADEVYAELHHKGQHTSIARHYPEGTIVSTGLSKWVGAGGWRLGALVFPDQLRPLLDALVVVAGETFSSTSMPIQRAAIAAFEGSDDIERYLSDVRRVLSALGRFVSRRLQAVGVLCPQPTGGFQVFADFGPALERAGAVRVAGSRELALLLLEEARVAGTPGALFGRPEEELSMRFAYVDFDGAQTLAAVRLIPNEQPIDEVFLRRHAATTIDAIERVSRWVAARRR